MQKVKSIQTAHINRSQKEKFAPLTHAQLIALVIKIAKLS
jgi:hypothetical protein